MRVNGPYQHRARWRLVLVDEEGRRDVQSFESQRAAEEAAEAFRRKFCGTPTATVAQALDRYELYLRTRGNKPSTRRTRLYLIRSFLERHLERQCHRLTAMAERYAEIARGDIEGALGSSNRRNRRVVELHLRLGARHLLRALQPVLEPRHEMTRARAAQCCRR